MPAININKTQLATIEVSLNLALVWGPHLLPLDHQPVSPELKRCMDMMTT